MMFGDSEALTICKLHSKVRQRRVGLVVKKSQNLGVRLSAFAVHSEDFIPNTKVSEKCYLRVFFLDSGFCWKTAGCGFTAVWVTSTGEVQDKSDWTQTTQAKEILLAK